MKRALRLARWGRLPAKERHQRLRALVRDALSLPNGEIAELEAEIREFERRYETTSDKMRRQLVEGGCRETAEIAAWMIAVDLRDRIAAGQART